jgi:hypothetical protein
MEPCHSHLVRVDTDTISSLQVEVTASVCCQILSRRNRPYLVDGCQSNTLKGLLLSTSPALGPEGNDLPPLELTIKSFPDSKPFFETVEHSSLNHPSTTATPEAALGDRTSTNVLLAFAIHALSSLFYLREMVGHLISSLTGADARDQRKLEISPVANC